jgi:hypothetical protein
MDIDPVKMIELVSEKTVARNLFENERNKKVVNTSGAYYYLNKLGKFDVLSGVLPRLKSVYWKNSSIYRQMNNVTSHPLLKTKKKKKKKKKSRGKYNGIITGTEVHRQLRDFVVLDEKNFKKNHKSLHDYSSRILKVIIQRMQWQPFLPEFDLYDDDLGVGTSIDMICLNPEGRLILLEFKTGYKDYFENADGFMHGCLKSLRNTPQNQATLQLTTSALILQKKYAVPLSKMSLFLLRVDDESLDIVPVDNLFVERIGPSIYKDLLEFNNNRTSVTTTTTTTTR